MFQMPQVTNAAHGGTPANTQYQQKYTSHHVPYGTTTKGLLEIVPQSIFLSHFRQHDYCLCQHL